MIREVWHAIDRREIKKKGRIISDWLDREIIYLQFLAIPPKENTLKLLKYTEILWKYSEKYIVQNFAIISLKISEDFLIWHLYLYPQEAKRQASLEHYNRMGMLEELRIDKVVEENKKLERDLNKIMKGLNKTSNGDDASEERYMLLLKFVFAW